METNMLIIGLIIYYLVGVMIGWRYTSIAYSKGGIYYYYHCKLDGYDLFLTFLPIFNTICFTILWIIEHPKGRRIDLNKFFNIKK